ncbi:MAG TPA: DUF2975 domain-containing protein [Streptosporangiaceae bacterium]|nr:DUF2975 domain-containing protein [Streptosporangiaceae bacterium]
MGSGSVGGFGVRAVCETLPNELDDTGTAPVGIGVHAGPGATIDTWGTFHACAGDPTIAQRIWYSLIGLPTVIFWACVLWILWRMLSTARSRGPFAPQVATALRRLGWFIIVGAVVASAVHGLALDAVLNSLFRPGVGYGDAVFGPIKALVPVPVIAGATMLTFARIIRAGQAMDEEIRATV